MKFITVTCQPKFMWGLIGVMTIGLLATSLVVFPKKMPIEQINVTEDNNITPSNIVTIVPKIKMHTVQAGETLGEIAAKYDIDVDTLEGANDNLSADIKPGEQVAILPSKGLLHTVDMGDTLWRLANLYEISVANIMSANDKNTEEILIGEKVFIPGAKKIPQAERQIARVDGAVSRGGSERFIFPTAGDLSSPFGYRWGRLHAGIDIANDTGTVVRAARSGRVSHAGWYSGYGYTVVIEHDQGYVTLYGHLNDYIVQNNQYVKGGQIIAYMGNTGNSTGPHLHFEVQRNGIAINPYNVLP